MKVNKKQQEITKTKLIEAAVDLMIKKGYEKSTMREIARQAGVGDATIYNYFSTKEGRKEGVIKIREEMKKAVKKDRYLSQEDAKLLNQFINKIRSELSETNQ